MNGSFRQAWEYLIGDVWDPLSAHQSAPTDLFIDLFTAADDYLAIRTPKATLELIRNDPDVARTSFRSLKGTDFDCEAELVEFMEYASEVVEDYDIAGYSEFYKRLVRESLKKYNLRYRIDDPFLIRFLLPGSFTNLYDELQKLRATNPHLGTLLKDFEVSFDRYAKTQDDSDLRACIARASNFAEGLASHTAGIPPTHNTLGALANTLADWPHVKLKEACQSIYKFSCDYPGIRHAGTPASKLRELDSRDLTVTTILLLAISGYLTPLLDERYILGA